jgi:hypothetical protein
MVLDDPAGTYTYLVEELNKLNFGYVELMKRSPYFPRQLITAAANGAGGSCQYRSI